MARPDDAWKDDLLAEPEVTGLQLMLMPAEHRAWLVAHPLTFVAEYNSDRLVNLTHPVNRKALQLYRSRHGGYRG